MKSFPGHILDRVHTAFVVALTFLSLVACKNDPGSRATHVAGGKDFWPEAPAPTIKTGTRTFRYNPQNIGRYKLVIDGGSSSAAVPLKLKMLLELDFRPGAAPSERNAHIETMDMWINAGPSRVVMRVNSQEFYFKQDKEETEVRRGDPGGLDVAGLTERPITIVNFDPVTNKVAMRANPEHPFETVGGGGATEMLDSGLVLFPDLPQGAVAPGHRWTSTRNTPIGGGHTRVEVTYQFEYVGDGACPSEVGTCSLLQFTASSPGVDAVGDRGEKLHATYGFAGKVFFNQERGSIDESRIRTEIDTKADGVEMPLAATYILEPRS